MATERQHIELAEQMAWLADQHWSNATNADLDEETQQVALQYAETAAQMAATRAQLACARALTADTADPRGRTDRARPGVDLTVTKIGDRL